LYVDYFDAILKIDSEANLKMMTVLDRSEGIS